ncbi:ABC transporter permease subunit, partial [Pantoea endophytica]
MDLFIIYAIEVLNAIAVLVIMSVGLAVVFGMMKIVNMAHGEFMMLGGYSAILATNQWGVPIWISMLVIAPLTVGVFGAVIERVIIRH